MMRVNSTKGINCGVGVSVGVPALKDRLPFMFASKRRMDLCRTYSVGKVSSFLISQWAITTSGARCSAS